MSTGAVAIVGVGMMTAVGLTAAETAASVRSATTRFGESTLRDKRFDPFTLAEVPADGLPALADVPGLTTGLSARERRLLRLGTMPLLECLRPLGGQSPAPGLCLALSEAETTKPLDRGGVLTRFAVQVGGVFDPGRSDASHVGRAGGLLAVGQAALAIEGGQADFMIAGGIDTYRDPYVLATLDKASRVKSDINLDGFVPGEGAGFLLLASPAAAASRGLTPIAHVSSVAVGHETGHLRSTAPYRGDGLAATFAQLVAHGAANGPVGEVYSSMTGESHWAKEWGVGYIRNKAMFHAAHGMHHPADCYGETGAASGPLMVGLAVLGIKGGYRRGPALVYGSSDRGARAAVIVSSPLH